MSAFRGLAVVPFVIIALGGCAQTGSALDHVGDWMKERAADARRAAGKQDSEPRRNEPNTPSPTAEAQARPTTVAKVSASTGSPFDTFKRDWTGRRVVLVQSLYTVQYAGIDKVWSPGVVDTLTAGITVASKQKGTYYYAAPKGSGTTIADPDLDRFVQRVTAATANQNPNSVMGTRGRNVTAPPAVLLTYKPGTSMTVADVYIRDQWLRLDLDDEFNKRRGPDSPNTTSLLVEWSGKFSNGFSERAEVENLIARFVKGK